MEVRVHRSHVNGGSKGILSIGCRNFPCALGKCGVSNFKREGDGCTPVGRFQLVQVFYRPDRVPRPITNLPTNQLRFNDGWCDDPQDTNYNCPVKVPYHASCERLWRKDHLYDYLVVLDYNIRTVMKYRGSAIFLHNAANDFQPTEGCVAIQPDHMRILLANASNSTFLAIG